MASRKHLVAVNRTIRAGDLDESGLDAAVVELARDLARALDSAGADAALNLVRSYQSAVKDLQRAAARIAEERMLPRIQGESGPESGREAEAEPTASEGATVTSLDDWEPKATATS